MRSPTPGRFRQADTILDAALDLETGERPGFVDRACDGDPELRALVHRLLRAFERSGDFLAEPALGLLDALSENGSEPPGDAVETARPEQVGPYRIVRELGRGGMGVVYLAVPTNVTSADPVALKVVRGGPQVAGSMLRRFLAERHILGRLVHRYVARLLETGITPDGTPYFAMTYCPGGSLSERLLRGPLPPAEALRIARQLSEALAAAHEMGIVHRDVKPANVLFSATGDVQLTDFGVAKLMDQESTRSGSLIGTPAYLAPEQLRGNGVDHRADLWAVGVSLYQMLLGRRPFDGPSYAAILHAVLAVEPEPAGRSAVIPPALEALIQHLLCKDPEARPQSALDLVRVLAMIEADPAAMYVHSPVPPSSADRTPSPRVRGTSVVVLPFANTSGNTDDTPLTDGLTDELINALGKVRGLRVTARTTAFALKGKGLDARAVTNMLGVTYLLEGSVRRLGERLKVTAHLVQAPHATLVWSESFDREVRDIFEVQEELARAIVAALAPRLGGAEMAPSAAPRRDVATYELYLKGRYFWEKRTLPDLQRAADYYRQATERDPTYAEAFAGLADTQVLLTIFGGMRPADTIPVARAAMAEALRLGGDIASVHASNGNLLSAFEWRWAESESELRLAMELDPTLINSWLYLSIQQQHLGRFDEAIEVASHALVLDPLSPALNLTLGRAHMHAGRPAEGLGPLRTAVEIAPRFAFALTQLGHVLLQLGRGEEAVEVLRRAVEFGGQSQAGQLVYGLASTGRQDEARTLLDAHLSQATDVYLPPFGVASGYSGLGEHDAAFEWLERGYVEHAAGMNTLKVAPSLAGLRNDPRWRDLLTRMELW